MDGDVAIVQVHLVLQIAEWCGQQIMIALAVTVNAVVDEKMRTKENRKINTNTSRGRKS